MAGQSEGTTTLVQEREELMVSSSSSSSSSSASPILRLAHFLTPSNNYIHGSAIHPPPEPISSSDLESKESHIRLNFCRWNNPLPEWKEWVDLMYSKHQTLWKKAGILEAVLNSKYTICRNEELSHAFASRWCSETNTFVFPWGEATLTLEDMMMLGGYSVLGDPVFSPLDTHKLKAIEKKLEHERSELSKMKSKKASHGAWLGKFMNSGNEIEHEAFLVYWLSRFVFPLAAESIVKCVFPVAIHLAKGVMIALAPAVLASIYSDLSAYKKAVFLSERLVGSKYEERIPQDVLLSSPFSLIQIWVWERFPHLQPKPKNVKPEEPSFAKWHDLKRNGGGIVTNVTHKVVDSFIWRPYTTFGERFLPRKIKGREEQRLSVTSCIDEEVEAIIRYLRVSELVGIVTNCIEQYLPHRVARQFDFDQDIPGLVERANSDQLVAWGNYNRPVKNRRFCIPSRLYERNVTVRYLEWWKKPVSAQDGYCEAFADGMTIRELKKRKLSAQDVDCEAFADGMTLMDLKNQKLYTQDFDCEAFADGMTLRELTKRKLSAQDIDCEAFEDGMTLRELKRRKPSGEVCDSAGSTCNAVKEKGSRDKEFLDSSKNSNTGGSENKLKHNRVFYDGIKPMSLKSAAKKPDVDVLVPPGYPSKCNNNAESTSKEVNFKAFVEKISNNVKQNEVKSVFNVELEARISNLETILCRYICDRGLA